MSFIMFYSNEYVEFPKDNEIIIKPNRLSRVIIPSDSIECIETVPVCRDDNDGLHIKWGSTFSSPGFAVVVKITLKQKMKNGEQIFYTQDNLGDLFIMLQS